MKPFGETAELKIEEVILDHIFWNSLNPMWIANSQGTLIKVNKSCLELLHINEKDVLGKYNIFKDNIFEDQGLMQLVKDVFDKGSGTRFSIEYECQRHKGDSAAETAKKYLDVSIAPITSSSGKVTNAIIQYVDATQSVLLKNDLASKEKELRLVTDNLPLLISHKSKDFKYIYANSAYTGLFGLTTDEIVGKSDIDLIGEEAFNLLLNQLVALKNGKEIQYLSTLKDKNGKERVYQITNLPELKDGEFVGFYTMGLDITVLKNTEDALKEREFVINETQQKTGLGSWTYDPNLQRYDWSKEMYTIFGLSGDADVITKRIYEKHIHKIDFHRYKEALEKSLSDGSPFLVELRILRPDGGFRVCTCIGETIIDREGRVIKIKGTLQDITQLRKLVDDLRESELQFKTMFSKHGSIMLLVEPDSGRITDANQAAADFYGYSITELRIMNMSEINMMEAGEIREKMSDVNSEKNKFFKAPHRLNSGEIRQVEVFSSPINYGGNRLLFSIIHDITERVRIENALNESWEKYKLLFNAASDPILIVDFEGHIIDVNDMAITEYGYSRAEFLLLNVRDLDDPEHRNLVNQRIEKAVGDGFILFETIHQRKDGSHLYSFINSRKIVYTGRDALYCVCRNITERKQAELMLEEKKQELQNINNQKDKFFSILAHDLRSPFNSVLGLVELLQASLQENNIEELGEHVEMIAQAATKATNLLNNLMEWARTQTGRIIFSPIEYDLVDQLDHVVNFYLAIAEQKGIKIVAIKPAIILIMADRDMLATVLRNLISNAIKFTCSGGNITIKAEIENGAAVVKIIDTGVGIPEASLEKLFRIDSKCSTVGTNKEQGTGLGLILCKEFVVKNGGTIGVTSQPGKGSEFWFTIPAVQQ